MTENKTLIVISGVTGAIGSALFAEYAQNKNNIVYGISRKALPVESFLQNGKIPHRTLICSIGDSMDFSLLFKSIDYVFKEVVYVHALGLYPFEVNSEGDIVVENDLDNDGINDEVTKLTYDAFVSATQNLQKYCHTRFKAIIFGGIADKYKPSVHQSWWRTIERVKKYMKVFCEVNKNATMVVFNISSVLCTHELITRPFVFTNTDAQQKYWLSPYDLSKFVVKKINKIKTGHFELEKFNAQPKFLPEKYYADNKFTPRKVSELF